LTRPLKPTTNGVAMVSGLEGSPTYTRIQVLQTTSTWPARWAPDTLQLTDEHSPTNLLALQPINLVLVAPVRSQCIAIYTTPQWSTYAIHYWRQGGYTYPTHRTL